MNDPDILEVLLGAVIIMGAIIFMIVLFRLLEIFLPGMLKLGKEMVPKVRSELDAFFPNLWAFVWGPIRRDDRVIKQEIHHHYAPQYDHSQKAQNITRANSISHTQNITDSVYYNKGDKGAGGVEGTGFCQGCGNALQPVWNVCPFCAKPID